jgi:hypothetical protein
MLAKLDSHLALSVAFPEDCRRVLHIGFALVHSSLAKNQLCMILVL